MAMKRDLLPDERVHVAVREKRANYHKDVVEQARRAIAEHDVVVLGMQMNPFPRKARRLLEQNKIPFTYLEWGSYASEWHPRLAIKLWSGWPTFPQIFVKGMLIGGATDLAKLLETGELQQLLDAPRVS